MAAMGNGIAAAPQLISDLVSANHILYDQGVLDAFGHVSARHDQAPERFLLARNMAPALVTADDVLEFQLDGEPIAAAGRAVYLERFIHGEIYRARPDVMAIVHSHSPAVLPFSTATASPLRALCHMAGFLGTATPVYEIRDFAGDGSDLLITDRRLGASLAQVLGDKSVVLMRGHGSTAVADSLITAVYRAVYTEVNARSQSDALRLGPVNFMTEAEGRSTAQTIEGQAKRAWDLWKKSAEVRCAALAGMSRD
ncbi:MAG TPA: class II aldolase/adducin family protein [Rhodocyclaceae bacterium]|nr:class II aldolase/adducin family protein [Rhodocyclaceae bacterium]